MDDKRDLFTKCFEYDEPKKVKAAGVYPYFRAIGATEGPRVLCQGKMRVMIGSNNYLGLTHDARVKQAAKDAIDKYGTGCTGSRFLNGNLELHEELERRLCAYLGRESCLIFATGFLTNQGVLSSLVGRRDVIYSDRENHASIFEGTRAAIGKTIKYRHSDYDDLKRILETTRGDFDGALIVTDGVFSMSGEIADLPALVKLAREYQCRLYVDDAHALGVLGPQGQGTANHFGITEGVDIVMGTFSKSFASLGGYVAGSRDVIDYIRHKARHFIFSAAMPPAAAGTVLECLEIIQKEPNHLENLWKNTKLMRTRLKSLGFNTLGSQTPIIPLVIGDDRAAFAFTQQLFENGVFATPVISPAVPEGSALIRTSYMATHTTEDLTYVLETLERLGKEFGVLGPNRIYGAVRASAEAGA